LLPRAGGKFQRFLETKESESRLRDEYCALEGSRRRDIAESGWYSYEPVQNRGVGEKEMAKNIQARRIQSKTAAVPVKWSDVDADELKSVVRDRMVGMNMSEREEFIGTLEGELRRAGLNMRGYLVPLGIPGRSTEELTPTEVAHLIRFLKLNISQAMPAIERALARYEGFATEDGGKGHKIAA
jgi:hypothetical protein